MKKLIKIEDIVKSNQVKNELTMLVKDICLNYFGFVPKSFNGFTPPKGDNASQKRWNLLLEQYENQGKTEIFDLFRQTASNKFPNKEFDTDDTYCITEWSITFYYRDYDDNYRFEQEDQFGFAIFRLKKEEAKLGKGDIYIDNCDFNTLTRILDYICMFLADEGKIKYNRANNKYWSKYAK